MKTITRTFEEIATVTAIEHSQTPESDACKEIRISFHYHPIAVIQMLAWEKMGFLPDGTMLECTDWDEVNADTKAMIKGSLIPSASRIVSGSMKPDAKGNYVIDAIQALVTVQTDGIHVRPPRSKLT